MPPRKSMRTASPASDSSRDAGAAMDFSNKLRQAKSVNRLLGVAAEVQDTDEGCLRRLTLHPAFEACKWNRLTNPSLSISAEGPLTTTPSTLEAQSISMSPISRIILNINASAIVSEELPVSSRQFLYSFYGNFCKSPGSGDGSTDNEDGRSTPSNVCTGRVVDRSSRSLVELGSVLLSRTALEKFQQSAASLRRHLSGKSQPLIDQTVRQWCMVHFAEQAKQVIHVFAHTVVHDECSLFVKVKTVKLLLTRFVDVLQLAGVSFPTFSMCLKANAAASFSDDTCGNDEHLIARIRQIDEVFSHSTIFASEIADIVRKLFAHERENDIEFTRTLDLQLYGLYHVTYALMLLRRYRKTDTAAFPGHTVSTFIAAIDRHLPASVKDIDLGMWMDAFMPLHTSLYELGILHESTATALARFQADLIGYHVLSRAEEELLIKPNFVRYLDFFIADEVIAFTTYIYHNAVIMSLVEAAQAKQQTDSKNLHAAACNTSENGAGKTVTADPDEVFILHAVQILGYYISDCLDVMLQKGHHIYSRILLESLYDMILLWPTSRPAMVDLGQTMLLLPADEQHQHMLKLKRDITVRLLHPGTPTRQILTVYVKLVQAFRVVDPSCTLLRLVHEPVRDYIRQRRDTVPVIMKSFARLSSGVDAASGKSNDGEKSLPNRYAGSELDALIALDSAPPSAPLVESEVDADTIASSQQSVSVVGAWTGGLDVRSALRRRAEASASARRNESRSHFSAATSQSSSSATLPSNLRRVRFATRTPTPINDVGETTVGKSDALPQKLTSDTEKSISLSSTSQNNDADIPLDARIAALGLSLAVKTLNNPPGASCEPAIPQNPERRGSITTSPLATSSLSHHHVNGSAAASPLAAAMQPIRIPMDDWRTWQPEPAYAEELEVPKSSAAATNSSSSAFRKQQHYLHSSTLDILIGIYGGQEVFVKEYQVLLAEKLLGYYAPLNMAVEQNVMNKLLTRFGQRMMHNCEVMLRDGILSREWCGIATTASSGAESSSALTRPATFTRRPLFVNSRRPQLFREDSLRQQANWMKQVLTQILLKEQPQLLGSGTEQIENRPTEPDPGQKANYMLPNVAAADNAQRSESPQSDIIDIDDLPLSCYIASSSSQQRDFVDNSQNSHTGSNKPQPQWSVLMYSGEYWPEMPVETLRLPEPFDKMQDAVRELYEKSPSGSDRTLHWRSDLGYVTLKLRLSPGSPPPDGSESHFEDDFVRISCPAYYAAILIAFQQHERWSLVDLAEHLQTTPDVLKRKIRYWIQRGVLSGPILSDEEDSTAQNATANSEEARTFYTLNEQLNRQLMTSALEAARTGGDYLGGNNDDEDEAADSAGDSSKMRQHHHNRQGEEFANQVQFFWRYIQSMLISVKTLTLDRMYAMLKMFVNRSQTTREVTKDQLRGFLESKIERRELILNAAGSYSLPAKR